ncbi:epimerase [Candidatus Levyibacteriota bacterium]|nr:SDR family oxidoreductase [Candidatus Levybacteria bacterium]MSU25652.1 SDR family oxidoreductase [Candidatus Levybacteria bacterium]GDX61742.1 epimerase [Candidatus Levybacteria bacterium]
MQKVIVAGGAGFIGSYICRQLLEKGYLVVCIDNFITGDKKNIEDLDKNNNFHLLDHDLATEIPPSDLLNNISYIFHLASPASPNKKSKRSYINFPIETLLVNSVGSYNLLMLAKSQNARFLFASSSEIYGDPEVSPQTEDYFGNVNSRGIRSVYDEGKRFGEAITTAFFRKHNMDTRIVRIFNTYGPRMQIDDGRVVSNFINQALRNEPITVYGAGMQTRSFCYITDLVNGLLKLMFIDNLNGEVINLGNPDERNIVDVARFIKNKIESSSEIIFETLPEDDPKKRKPDISKAKKLLDWKPEVSFEDGLEKTIEYFKIQK